MVEVHLENGLVLELPERDGKVCLAGVPLDLGQVARYFRITRQRAAQLEFKAMRKLHRRRDALRSLARDLGLVRDNTESDRA